MSRLSVYSSGLNSTGMRAPVTVLVSERLLEAHALCASDPPGALAVRQRRAGRAARITWSVTRDELLRRQNDRVRLPRCAAAALPAHRHRVPGCRAGTARRSFSCERPAWHAAMRHRHPAARCAGALRAHGEHQRFDDARIGWRLDQPFQHAACRCSRTTARRAARECVRDALDASASRLRSLERSRVRGGSRRARLRSWRRRG